MTNSATVWQLEKIEQSEINVLILTTDQLRGDLLGAGIRAAAMGTSETESIWEYDRDEGISESDNANVVLIDLGESGEVERGISIGHKLMGNKHRPSIIMLAGTNKILTDVRMQMTEVDPRWSFLASDSISGLPDLIRIIESAAAGMTIVDPGFLREDCTDGFLTRPLTARQIQVLQLLSQGYNNDAIGVQLNIAGRTVEFHLQEVYLAIKNCHSPQYNPRVYAAKIFSDHVPHTKLANPKRSANIARAETTSN